MKKNRFDRKWACALVLSLCLAQGSGLAFGQAARAPITHEAIWLMKRVGAPVPSPDGRWVVFTLIDPAYDEKEQSSDLWIVPGDGSAKPRQLTSTKAGESGAAWSPDGKYLAFAARRDGDESSQIYLLNVAEGGEALRVTSLSTGARAPKWSPDGKWLLFASAVFPGAADDDANKKIAAERKAQKYKARVFEGFPIRDFDHWLDDTQPHVFVQAAEPGAKAKDLLAGSQLVAQRGFEGAADLEAVWAPDGRSIVFAATTEGDRAAYAPVGADLYEIAVTGGEPKKLTAGEGTYMRPAFRPDGKALYAAFRPENGKVYNLDRLVKFGWPALGKAENLTASFDRSVGVYACAADSRAVYFLAENAGHENLYSVGADGGGVKPVIELTRGVYANLTIPGKSAHLFATWESAVNPAEIVRIDLADKKNVALTDFNGTRAAAIDWQPLREFWFTSKAGKRVHSFISLPPGFDENKRYPLVVLIHGGPHGMWRDYFFLRWNYHLLAQPGYVILMTDFTGSTGYGEKFAQDIQGDPFVTPGNELNEAADEAIRLFKFVDGSRQAAGGASYGGHLANWLQATTTRYKCLFSHAGLINLESQWGTSDTIYHREVNNGGPVWEQGKVWREQNPIRYAAKFKTPILLTVGENDFRVPLNQTLENWSVLQRLRIPSKLIVFPDENHWILRGENSRFFYGELHAWLKKYLSPGE